MNDETLDALLADADTEYVEALSTGLDIEAGLTSIVGTDEPAPRGRRFDATRVPVGADDRSERRPVNRDRRNRRTKRD